MTAPTWEQVEALLKPLWSDGGSTTPTPPTPTPTPDVPGVKVVQLPWATTQGRAVVRIAAGGSVAFKFTVPASYKTVDNNPCSFSFSPTTGADYFMREMMISDKPGDFTGGPFPVAVVNAVRGQNQAQRENFTVGAPYMRGVLVKRPDPAVPLLEAGKTYYFNVRQVDQTITCQIDYSLQIRGN